MKKQEISRFKNYYLDYLKNNNSNSNICEWLQNAVDFEEPDGYYFDSNSKLLVIFEHFDIDCSERIIKNGKEHGSILRKNSNDKYKEVHKEIESSSDYYESTKVIEQGYYKQDGNTKTFCIGQDGDKYRNNYIDNFSKSFEKHCNKIEEYKNNLIEKLKIQPSDIKVCFLVEDKTVFGTHYLSNKNSSGEPVVLTDTLQFQEIINNSNVNYIISGREQDRISSIGCKGDSEQDKIDLFKKEFFVIPGIPLFTASKKTQLP